MTADRTSLIATLVTLRWFAVAGQSVAVACVVLGLGVPLPFGPMTAAIALLAAFNLYAMRRARCADEPTPAEVFAHIAVDVAVLAFLIGCSGGPANPFTSLFLLPIAFAALALPQRWIYATAILCAAGYALAAAFAQPLPHIHGFAADGFDLHLIGMAVNFAISAVVFVYFLARLAAQRRERDTELANLRERFARDEGILALATHAASVAHELNTPLATMLLTLEELEERDDVPGTLDEDVALLHSLADTCRQRVRELARAGTETEGVDPGQMIERWHLLRPTVVLLRSGTLAPGTRIDAAAGHLIQALLDNAADASLAAGNTRVELHLEADANGVRGEIRDHGKGFDPQRSFLPGRLFDSGKPGGLGLGLALSHATVERLGGELNLHAVESGGARVSFRLPPRIPVRP